MEDIKRERAAFSVKAFWHALLVTFADIVVAAIVVMLVWTFVRWGVLDGETLPVESKDFVGMVREIAWPCSIGLLILLFRNPILRILCEVPSFIRRSYYRCNDGKWNDVLSPGMMSKPIGDRNIQVSPTLRDTIVEETKKVAEELVRKFGGNYSIEKCIGDRRWMFDVVVESRNRIYGVEIKKNARIEQWQRVLERIDRMYENYSDNLKRRFVFVAVVADENTPKNIEQEIFELAQKREYITFVERIVCNV